MTNNLSLKKIATATGLFLGAFALSAFAGDWTPAGCAAPGCNTAAPINVSSVSQYKEGSLAVGKSSGPTNGFDLDVDGNVNFTGSLITSGISVSGLTNTLNLKVGGANANSSGYVLTNDGTGIAEWKAATGGGSSSTVKSGEATPNSVCTQVNASWCDSERYVDVVFSEPFSKTPAVLVSTKSTPVVPIGGYQFTSLNARAENITNTGFRMYCNNTITGGSGGGSGRHFIDNVCSWIAM